MSDLEQKLASIRRHYRNHGDSVKRAIEKELTNED